MNTLAFFCRRLLSLPVRLYGWLFDFSRGQDEGRQWERMLRTALAETVTDDEFMAAMRRLITDKEPHRTDVRWAFFLMRLGEYARTQTSDRRVAAERMLAALPRLYGYRPSTEENGE